MVAHPRSGEAVLPVDRRDSAFRVPEVIAKDLARHLEEQIIFGDVSPRSRLVEEEIVQRCNVSRSPVREALRALEQEGLVTRESRRGVWVSPMGLEDLEEVYSCRIVLEGLSAELAAQNRSDEDLAGIKATFDALEAQGEENDMREFFRINLALSSKIHSAANNATLKRLLGSIGKQSLRYRYLAYSSAPEMMSASVEGNREIITAIERQNARHARILMEDLIQRSWTVIRRFFTDNPNAASS